jgi:tetratricopeptide (TPR) repeat protein
MSRFPLGAEVDMKRFLFGTLAVLVLGGPAYVRGGAADDAEQLVQQADRLAREKKYDEALDAMYKALKLAPTNDRYLGVASEIERRAGRFADGVTHAVAAAKINDKIGLYYALAAANAYGNQDPEAARQYCRKVLDRPVAEVGAEIQRQAKQYEDMLQEKTYTITWNLDPTKGTSLSDVFSVALPKSDLPYQSVRVEVKGARSFRIVKGEVNDVVRVVPQGKSPFQVITTVTVRPISYKKKLEKAGPGPLPREALAFLGAAETFDPAGLKLRKIGSELKGKNAAATVRNVQAWMRKNVEYRIKEKSIVKLDFKNVDEILERASAECRGYAILFAALCRAAGVPARPVWGIFFQPGSPGVFASHNWDEVYVPGCGWVPVDPQKPETFGWLPTSHVRVFMDLRKSDSSPDNVPLGNLLYMNGEKLEYQEALKVKSPGEK